MQGSRGGRDPFFDFGDPFPGFGSFGGFGGQRSLVSSFFGGRDPFDDPFFTRPFGGMFESSPFFTRPFGGMSESSPFFTRPFGGMSESSFFGPNGGYFMDAHPSGFLENQDSQPNRSRGPIIEELNYDEEKEEEGPKEKKDNPRKHGRSRQEPYVEDPDETEERRSKQVQFRNDFNKMNNVQSQPESRSFTFQSSTVTYGGANGAYYTSSRARRAGSDGLTIEESKEADSASGRATHRVSRGIHDKGHSVTRKLNSDGMVNTMQTLHNLNEDELAGFEQAWKGNAKKHLPGWTEGFNAPDGPGSTAQDGPRSRGGWALPSTERRHHSGSLKPDMGERAGNRSQHSGKMRADIGDETGSSRGRPRGAGTSNMEQLRRH